MSQISANQVRHCPRLSGSNLFKSAPKSGKPFKSCSENRNEPDKDNENLPHFLSQSIIMMLKINIARVQNCPDVTIFNLFLISLVFLIC